MSRKRFFLLVGLVALAAALAGYMVSRQLAQPAPLSLASGTGLPTPRQIIPFALTDQQGRPFANAGLVGHSSLLFFGFTHCPDICPTTLALMAQLHHIQALSALQMIFVTVDPERDDAAAMRAYVEAFGGNMIGLRGEDAALDPLLKNLGAIRAIQKLPGGDYTVDHSATLYYIDAQGALAAVFTPPFDAAKLAADLNILLTSGH
ncbi:MAG: SCO family protein [Pseudomonadota bacterium]